MSSTNSTLEAFDPPAKPNALPFVALGLVAAGVCGLGLWQGHAPLDPYVSDWINWARIEPTWAGVFACGIILFVIGLFGSFMAVLPASKPKARPQAAPARSRPVAVEAAPVMAPAANPSMDDALDVPSPEGLTVNPRAPDARGSLKFDASRLSAERSEPAEEAVTAPLFAAAPVEMPSLEPAIFHDNASDSFMTRMPEAAPESVPALAAEPAFDAAAALSETHGLGIARAESAQIIPIRPDVTVAGLTAAADPLEAALLAEPVAAPRPAPQSDMSAVISSAMRFIETPVDEEVHKVEAVEAIPHAMIEPVAEIAASVEAEDGEAEVRQAVQTALSVWPESTRAIAADELGARISNLYYDPTPQSRQIFQLIASGDLSAASTALQTQADTLAQAGRSPEAAELWRVCGALHMGRDDGKALAAYEKVSELDPSDANIHLYLFRRYQMAGETAKQPSVIARALGVISDPSIRTELLTPFADLQMKAGQVQTAGDALEELTRLHETTAYLRPDDMAARSAHAITVARLAQAREMQGAFDQAGPLYKRAHQAFADLSAMKPDHPGLKAMAENALKDARRFGA